MPVLRVLLFSCVRSCEGFLYVPEIDNQRHDDTTAMKVRSRSTPEKIRKIFPDFS